MFGVEYDRGKQRGGVNHTFLRFCCRMMMSAADAREMLPPLVHLVMMVPLFGMPLCLVLRQPQLWRTHRPVLVSFLRFVQ